MQGDCDLIYLAVCENIFRALDKLHMPLLTLKWSDASVRFFNSSSYGFQAMRWNKLRKRWKVFMSRHTYSHMARVRHINQKIMVISRTFRSGAGLNSSTTKPKIIEFIYNLE